MEFVYYISEKEFDGNERKISVSEALMLIPFNSLQKLQDGKVFYTAMGALWAEEK